MTMTATHINALVTRVKSEYVEMPGLSLTLPQAQRLLGLDRTTCEALMRDLVATGFLTNTAAGRFKLASHSAHPAH